jgi:hypothetical protein
VLPALRELVTVHDWSDVLRDIGGEIVAPDRLRFGDRAQDHAWRWNLADAQDLAEHRDRSRYRHAGGNRARRRIRGPSRELARRRSGLSRRSVRRGDGDGAENEERQKPHG